MPFALGGFRLGQLSALALPLCLVCFAAGCSSTPDEPVADEAPLRRLTAAQYNNTVRDLLPDIVVPAVLMPPELHIAGFDNNTSVNTASPALVEAYQVGAMRVSEALADQFGDALPCEAVDEVEPTCAEEWLLALARLPPQRSK